MKSLSKLKLNHSARVLSNQELKIIVGGYTYTCYCGFEGGGYEHLKIQVEANSVGEALNSMNCGYVGATCN